MTLSNTASEKIAMTEPFFLQQVQQVALHGPSNAEKESSRSPKRALKEASKRKPQPKLRQVPYRKVRKGRGANGAILNLSTKKFRKCISRLKVGYFVAVSSCSLWLVLVESLHGGSERKKRHTRWKNWTK